MPKKRGDWRAATTGFGCRLQEIRHTKGLSAAKLADAVGCHTMTISKLERGEQEPAWPLVLALCAALDVVPTDFVPIDRNAALGV